MRTSFFVLASSVLSLVACNYDAPEHLTDVADPDNQCGENSVQCAPPQRCEWHEVPFADDGGAIAQTECVDP